MTTIAVGRRINIGNNVRIAGRAMLLGYPGHPLDPVARASGQPDTDDQVGDIILEDDVWLASGVLVLPKVRIGQGTIVAAGSVVTKDLPPMALAGGTPARVLRYLEHPGRKEHIIKESR
jgi:acetyltransferase-like isoleucine patch superfamily enzyme